MKTRSSVNLRAFIFLLGTSSVIVYAGIVIEALRPKLVPELAAATDLPPKVLTALGGTTSEASFRAAALGFAGDLDGLGCFDLDRVRVGAWEAVLRPGGTGDDESSFTLVGDGGHVEGLFSSRRCDKSMVEYSAVMHVAMSLGMLAWLVTLMLMGRSMVISSMAAVLESFMGLAAHVDEKGELKTLVQDKQGTMMAEDVLLRAVNSVSLLLSASFHGKALIRQVMRDANVVTGGTNGTGDAGLLALYGAVEGATVRKDREVGSPPEKKMSLLDEKGSLLEVEHPNGPSRPRVAKVGRNLLTYDKFVEKWREGSLTQPDCLKMTPEQSIDFIVDMFRTLLLVVDEQLDPLSGAPPEAGEPVRASASSRPSGPPGSSDVEGEATGAEVPQRVRLSRDFIDKGSGVQKTPLATALQGSDEVCVREVTLRRFCQECRSRYLDQPYHRWEHAVDVTHAMFVSLVDARSFRSVHLSRLDLFSLMISAIAHDMGHRGVSNTHLVQTRDVLALTYNDKSPQENLHASSLFHLCSSIPEADVFELLSFEHSVYARTLIIESIIDTDMAFHFSRLASLKGIITSPAEGAPALPGTLCLVAGEDPDVDLEDVLQGTRAYSTSEARCILLGLLHLADLGNCVKPVIRHVKWSLQVFQEFFREGSMQRERGVKPLPFMDDDACYSPASQMEFLDFVARPLFTVMAQVLPELRDTIVNNLCNNFDFWASMAVADKAAMKVWDLPASVPPRTFAEGVFVPASMPPSGKRSSRRSSLSGFRPSRLGSLGAKRKDSQAEVGRDPFRPAGYDSILGEGRLQPVAEEEECQAEPGDLPRRASHVDSPRRTTGGGGRLPSQTSLQSMASDALVTPSTIPWLQYVLLNSLQGRDMNDPPRRSGGIQVRRSLLGGPRIPALLDASSEDVEEVVKITELLMSLGTRTVAKKIIEESQWERARAFREQVIASASLQKDEGA